MKTFGILYTLGALLFGLFQIDNSSFVATGGSISGAWRDSAGEEIIFENTYTMPDNIGAKSVLLYDLAGTQTLVGRNIDYLFPIASLSKIMTGILSLEYITQGEVISISKDAVLTEGTAGDLVVGEEIMFEDLLSKMMMDSSNDAAMALAEEVGRRLGGNNFLERINIFVSLMNDKSFALGMQNTIFQNPTGLDLEDTWPSNYSRARDLALLVEETMKFPLFWEVSRESEMNILASRIPFFIGGKTGFTDNAKGSLILLFEHPFSRPLVLIILDAESRESRFLDAEAFLRENGIL